MRAADMDAYLAPLDGEKRAALERLRRIVGEEAPGAVECIDYGVPTFRLDGKALVAFGAGKGHCSFYPMSPDLQAAFAAELAEFRTGRGTIRFQPEHPIPEDLVRRMVRGRIAETRGLADSGRPGCGTGQRRDTG